MIFLQLLINLLKYCNIFIFFYYQNYITIVDINKENNIIDNIFEENINECPVDNIKFLKEDFASQINIKLDFYNSQKKHKAFEEIEEKTKPSNFFETLFIILFIFSLLGNILRYVYKKQYLQQ
jgi:hypothetical protein